MIPKVSVQMIANEKSEFGRLMFRSCVNSLLESGIVHEFVLVDNGCDVSLGAEIDRLIYRKMARRFRILNGRHLTRFDDLRNLALANSGFADGPPDWVFWVDTDEVYFPAQLRRLGRELLSVADNVGIVTQILVHFMVSPVLVFDEYRKDTIYRWSPDLHWEGAVHEKLAGATGEVYDSQYRYLHFGYCRPQWEVCLKWLAFAMREHGNLQQYKQYREEEGGPEKNYFGEQKTPDTILNDRLAQCKEYHGPYPTTVTWLDCLKGDDGTFCYDPEVWRKWLADCEHRRHLFWRAWQDQRHVRGTWEETLEWAMEMAPLYGEWRGLDNEPHGGKEGSPL